LFIGRGRGHAEILARKDVHRYGNLLQLRKGTRQSGFPDRQINNRGE
jgi:hypothetical protein